MSLLDDVSIVVTPNGYKAGELYAVIPVPTEGAELVTNWDMESGFTGGVANDYTVNLGTPSQETSIYVSSTNSQKISTSSSTARLSHNNISVLVQKRYIATCWVRSDVSQSVKFSDYNGSGESITETVVADTWTYLSFYITKGNTTFIPRVETLTSQTGYLLIDNVSVKEYTSADMDVTRATAATRVDENGLVNYAEVLGSNLASGYDFTSGWGIFGGGTSIANSTSFESQSGQGIYTGLGLVVNKLYKIKITGTQPSGGYFSLQSGTTGTNLKNISGTSFNEVIYATPTVVTGVGNDFYIRLSSHSVGSLITISNLEIEEVTRDNVPRIDYTGGGCPHILAEPQRTNEVTYSEAFDNASWATTNSTININSTTAPDGTLTATKLNETADDNRHGLYYSIPAMSNGNYSFSLFVKNNDRRYVILTINTISGTEYYGIVVDLETGTLTQENISSISVYSYKIEERENDWYKLSVSASCQVRYVTVALSNSSTFTPTDFGYNSYLGTNKSIYIWGAQLEEGSYPTSYIPTSGSTVTRNQDIFTRDGIGSLINSTEGVLFVEMAALSNDLTNRMISLSDGTSNNYVLLSFMNQSNKIRYNYNVGAVGVVDIKVEASNIMEFNKVAVTWKLNEFKMYLNGVKVGEDLIGSVVSPNVINQITFDREDTLHFFGKVKQLQVYDTSLSDEQLLQLTGESGTDFYESYAEMASALTYTIQ